VASPPEYYYTLQVIIFKASQKGTCTSPDAATCLAASGSSLKSQDSVPLVARRLGVSEILFDSSRVCGKSLRRIDSPLLTRQASGRECWTGARIRLEPRRTYRVFSGRMQPTAAAALECRSLRDDVLSEPSTHD
jgi:hypothetical protein